MWLACKIFCIMLLEQLGESFYSWVLVKSGTYGTPGKFTHDRTTASVCVPTVCSTHTEYYKLQKLSMGSHGKVSTVKLTRGKVKKFLKPSYSLLLYSYRSICFCSKLNICYTAAYCSAQNLSLHWIGYYCLSNLVPSTEMPLQTGKPQNAATPKVRCYSRNELLYQDIR